MATYNPSKPQNSPENRELVSVEQAMEIMNRYSGSYNVVIMSRISGPLTEEIVRKALDLVQSRHPRLNCRIVGELDSLRFETEGTEKIPLRVLPDRDWNQVVLEELNSEIDRTKYLARFAFIPPQKNAKISYLIATIHHAITDGLSSIQLQSEILTYCHKIASGEPLNLGNSLKPLPSLYDLIPASINGLRGKLNIMLFLWRLKFKELLYRPETLEFEKFVPVESRHCGWIIRQFDETLTQQIVDRCKQEKTTVQAAICAAMMFAVKKKIANGNERDMGVSCQSFIDLRRRLSPVIHPENLGMLASGVTSFHILKPRSSFWDLARDVRKQLESGLKSRDIFVPFLMLKDLTELSLKNCDRAPSTVALSNVGRVNIPSVYGDFQLKEISFVAGLAAVGGVFVAAATTFNDKMTLNFVFSKPSISRETMETLVNHTISSLIDCSKEHLPVAGKSNLAIVAK
jgi:Condensation domain